MKNHRILLFGCLIFIQCANLFAYSNFEIMDIQHNAMFERESFFNRVLNLNFQVNEDQYAKLNRKLQDGFYMGPSDDILKVEYDEEYIDTDSKLTFKIFNRRQQVVLSSASVIETVVYGDNRIDFDVSSLPNGSYYILEVINEKNESFYLRFKTHSLFIETPDPDDPEY